MDGYEMTHIASRGIEKVPYCFWGHPSNFNVTGDYIVGWHMIVLGYSVGCTSVAPFSTVLCAALTMRLFHHIYTLVCDGGSLEALTFSSIGPCTWLLFSALCTVWIDIVLSLQVHDDQVPARLAGERSPASASSKLSNKVMCLGIGNPLKLSDMHGSLVCAHAVVPRQFLCVNGGAHCPS